VAKTRTAPACDYRLTISPHFNERRQVPTTLITLETTKLFASFRYELSVKEDVQEASLHYTILGLKAPQLSLPASGSAQFVREYDELKGKHDIIVKNLDGTTNEFSVNFLKKKVAVLKSPKQPFIELVVT